MLNVTQSLVEGDGQVFNEKELVPTELTSINIARLLRLEQSFNVIVGNDRRIKIWNQSNELVCDYNINVTVFLFSIACLISGT